MVWTVKFFQTARGDSPVEEFIKKLDEATYSKILHSIVLLRDYGPTLKPPYTKKIKNKLYELRISKKVAVRIFYMMINEEYYLLHVFKKKTQKIPAKELKIALDRMRKLV